jgi:hypothetical protein
VLRTFAVAFIGIVTGLGPQANRIMPPERTAAITAADVQLAGVPCPTVCAPARPGATAATISAAPTASSHARLIP